jgi:competence protein ComEC
MHAKSSVASGAGPNSETRRRSPALPVAAAFALGIFADHRFEPDLGIWLVGCAALLGLWLIALWRGFRAFEAPLLLAAVVSAGALWHHWRWSIVAADHIVRFSQETPQPVRLAGRLVDRPAIIPRQSPAFPTSIPHFDRTLCTLECRTLISGKEAQPVSGRVRLEIDGQWLSGSPGDEVEVVGILSRPGGPRNPGAFDYRRYLRSDGLLASVHCGEPEDVRVTQSRGSWFGRLQGGLRTRAERMLQRQLSDRTAPVGIALLLGTRTSIPEELKNAFSESGTMHILAISGSNVGILAGLLWLVARIAGFGRRASIVLILAGVLGYAFLADAQPPVMRAVLMIVALLAGRPWHREAPLVNGLALAGLGVLIWNPAHLFDVGAQLSFLAVAGLIWAPGWSRRLSAWALPPDVPGDLGRPALLRVLRSGARLLITVLVTIAAIWLFTLPLTIARFHLVSLVGFFVNILLAPLVVVILWCGYALLLLGLLWPAFAAPFAFGYDAGLKLMLEIIERSAALPGGHFYLPGPPDWWLAVFYAFLAAVAWGVPAGRLRYWAWRAMLLWVVGGLGVALWPAHPGELRCTFLSVGHGLAVVVELPGGRVLVYDAGQMQDGQRAARTVQAALLDFGVRSIDALVISHADVDHFNGIPGLARTLPVGSVLVHESFLDFRQPGVEAVCNALTRQGVPIKLIWAGDRVSLDNRALLTVLHPAVGDRLATDNANSLVLAVEYAGRRILLTGDLEGGGLESLLFSPPLHADILLAPHHGRFAANPRALAEWASPDWVIVSDGRHDNSDRLSAVYGDQTRILSTQKSGAITFVIDQRGVVRCEPFVQAAAKDGKESSRE